MIRVVVLTIVVLGAATLAAAPTAVAKPLCAWGSDCDGYVCTTWDSGSRRWRDCAVDYVPCGLNGEHCPVI